MLSSKFIFPFSASSYMYMASGAFIVDAAKIGWLLLYDNENPVYKSLYLKAKLRLD